MENYQGVKLFVAIPCFGGKIYSECLTGLLDLQIECLKKGIPLKVLTLGNESLITRARNICSSRFLDDSSYTHLLFIDADIGFKAKNVLRLLEFNKEMCCGIYPRKDIDWAEVLKLSRGSNISPEMLEAMSLGYNIKFPDPKNVMVKDGFVETTEGATGMMLIKREVFEKMKSSYPELKYVSDHQINLEMMHSENTYLFFDCVKDDNGRYLSEDYTFCKRWRDIDGKIFSDITMPLTHTGTYPFEGHVGTIFTE
jgi:hypothetical protein